MNPNAPCALCGEAAPLEIYETHTDRWSKKSYTLYRCPRCEGHQADPLESPDPSWYAQAYPFRTNGSPPQSDWRFRLFLQRHPQGQGQRLLDIGTGSGIFVGQAQAKGYTAEGVDYDERTIRWGLDHGIRSLTAAPIDSYLQGLPEASFDWITLFEVLEHIPNPEALLRQCYRLLKPSGHVLVVVPNFNRLLLGQREEHDYPPHHLTRWTAKTLITLLSRTGFHTEWLNDNVLPTRHVIHDGFDHALAWIRNRWRGRRKSVSSDVTPSSEPPSAPHPRLWRQQLVNTVREVVIVALWIPATLVLWVWKQSHPHRGPLLYAEAKKQ